MFRGLSLADTIAPFIAINNGDAKSSFSFTLLHELTHIVLNQSYLSNSTNNSTQKSEKFCDEVAPQILLPPKDRKRLNTIAHGNVDVCLEGISDLAKEWKVSNSMVAYQMFKEEKIFNSFYKKISHIFKKTWEDEKKKNKNRKGGPSSNRLVKNYTGKKLLDLTKRGLDAGYIVPTQAAQIIGIQNALRVYKVLY